MSDNKSFKEETFGTKLLVIIAMTLLIIGVIAFVIAVYYFGILGLFSLLGVQFDSLWSLLLFVISYFLLSIIGDFVIDIFKSLISFIGKLNNIQLKASHLIFSFLVNLAIISLLNELMNSIELKLPTQIILSFIFAIMDVVFEDKKKPADLP